MVLVYTNLFNLIVKQAIPLIQIMLQNFPGTNQYWAMTSKLLAQGHNRGL